MNKNLRKKKKGFTLIELIVVIAILGILAGIAVPRFGASRTNAANTAHNANVRTIQSAAMMYLAENGNPDAAMTATTTPTAQSEVEKYLQDWPTVPKGGTATGTYSVEISTTGEVTVTPAAVTLP